ncbi:hypothetical protein [Brevibacterium sp. CT2-23B]|uniref:hypothetical protein n=1 Tax=Brevibacterium sp. CT2-23B TaxID=2729630 RepID=UPI0015558F90|nr:hypothetical protein [Brevibacterium sp. CT2-23B]
MDVPHDPEVDAVLTSLLGSLGESSSVFGAGRLGAEWSAKRLKTETHHAVIEVPPDETERVLNQVTQLVSAHIPATDDPVVTIRGVIGSGFASMNPAYVIVVLDRRESTLGIAAHAKEGLIKQRTAQKAVTKIREAIAL